jgi:hypothetical protein
MEIRNIKIVGAILILLLYALVSIANSRLLGYEFIRPISFGQEAPSAGDSVLWDATNDKVLWDASGDEVLWE